jgi:hypothetical protein
MQNRRVFRPCLARKIGHRLKPPLVAAIAESFSNSCSGVFFSSASGLTTVPTPGMTTLPGRAPDVNLEGSFVHQDKLEISGYLILSRTLVISVDLKTPRFCGI